MALQLLARSPHPRTAETLNPGEATNTYTCYAAVSTALAIALPLPAVVLSVAVWDRPPAVAATISTTAPGVRV